MPLGTPTRPGPRPPLQHFSRQQILRALRGGEHTDTNTLTVHIKRLLTRIRTVEGSCCTTDTVRALGYRLECPDEARTP
ncbi:helix-turn-helix domain-containing protein [Streptomyces sp. NPDC023998]|uniref:winged helix-turn-helix domain-containing protein n=1 Tax=Streptomyces sp. NPDC023998 TaxID=3154597 RepID=UPI00340C821A